MDMKRGRKILSLVLGKGHWLNPFISFTKVGEKETESDSERKEKERMRYIVFFGYFSFYIKLLEFLYIKL